jgi:hypothetical protein
MTEARELAMALTLFGTLRMTANELLQQLLDGTDARAFRSCFISFGTSRS